ncbi:MAG TPA: ribosomal protein S18-alanine N-acetyltransferase [Gemmatimonadales bacterium]|nr:ribosomal protein S18-alanine N-acetyltransferase [Gemmatimonadales bacterium]
MDSSWRIRRAEPADAVRLLPIERRCFADPWSVAAFAEILESPLGFGLVAECGPTIGGYLVARLVAGEAEILNLAVGPEDRGKGLGSELLRRGVAGLAAKGAREIYLEVREHNLVAQQLYRSLGFRPVGLRARYYRNPVEDALVLRLGLPGPA